MAENKIISYTTTGIIAISPTSLRHDARQPRVTRCGASRSRALRSLLFICIFLHPDNVVDIHSLYWVAIPHYFSWYISDVCAHVLQSYEGIAWCPPLCVAKPCFS